MEIGRKIYYGKSNGLVIWDKGEMSGSVEPTTFENDKEVMPILALLSESEIGVKQLEFGEMREQFEASKGYLINPITEEIIFVE